MGFSTSQSPDTGNTTTRIRQGFSEQDVQSFLRRGNTLASTQDPSSPTRPPRREVGFVEREGGGSPERIGFTGQLSNKSEEQIDALANTFLLREKQIRQRRAQPGRSALFLARQ